MSTRRWASIRDGAATAERFGDRLAVVDGDTRLTYAELLDEARGFGAALVASGVEPGDRVAIWAPNSAEWIVAVLGLFQAGAVLVPVNTRFKGAEAADILSRSRARVLVTVTDFLGTDYVAMLRDDRRRPARPADHRRGPGPGARRHRAVGRVPGPGDRRRPRPRSTPPGRGLGPTTRRTSCSRRARPACPRAWS